jgi:hypothetical protein
VIVDPGSSGGAGPGGGGTGIARLPRANGPSADGGDAGPTQGTGAGPTSGDAPVAGGSTEGDVTAVDDGSIAADPIGDDGSIADDAAAMGDGPIGHDLAVAHDGSIAGVSNERGVGLVARDAVVFFDDAVVRAHEAASFSDSSTALPPPAQAPAADGGSTKPTPDPASEPIAGAGSVTKESAPLPQRGAIAARTARGPLLDRASFWYARPSTPGLTAAATPRLFEARPAGDSGLVADWADEDGSPFIFRREGDHADALTSATDPPWRRLGGKRQW